MYLAGRMMGTPGIDNTSFSYLVYLQDRYPMEQLS